MKKAQNRKKTILKEDKNRLLHLKELLDQLLKECDSLPVEIKSSIISARNAAWKHFSETHERINSSTS